MGELVPLSEGIPNEARELAIELRRFFQSLNISVRRYAARCNYDPATVSRYLNGKRVPPWPFIQRLLAEVSEQRGFPIQQGALEVVRKLHRTALQASNKHLYTVQILQDKLAEADKEYKRAGIREKALLEAVEIRQHRIAMLELETLELNSSLLEERSKSTTLQRQLESAQATEDELGELRAEVQELKTQLGRAQELTQQAEARCEELEQQLREAEEAAISGQEAREQEQLEVALREASEARSLADRLREELEEVRNEIDIHEANTKPAAKQPTKTPLTPGEQLAKAALTMDPIDLAKELVRLNLSSELEEFRASNEIAMNYPLPNLGELILEIDKLSHSQARSLMLAIGRSRTPEDTYTLIRDFGHHTVDGSSNLGSDAVNWFTRGQDWPKIRSLMDILENAGWKELAQQCITDTGSNQENRRFINTLNETSGVERATLLRSSAQNRSAEKLLELLSILNTSDTNLLSDVLTSIVDENPKRAKDIQRILDTLGIVWSR
ncbi:helix-turn-helix transcriptional regulator [Streptomyces sp. GbtcB6]|uniref:helix-turn-helix domain-containing protein n=1 Tax=Streptomyces sp. GbtcB6 TaxID=2824751 RepID=UPI001C3085EA|nr:helix-turn-helix transcriptional regulator [Streptomyces sp. GbtcB6]